MCFMHLVNGGFETYSFVKYALFSFLLAFHFLWSFSLNFVLSFNFLMKNEFLVKKKKKIKNYAFMMEEIFNIFYLN